MTKNGIQQNRTQANFDESHNSLHSCMSQMPPSSVDGATCMSSSGGPKARDFTKLFSEEISKDRSTANQSADPAHGRHPRRLCSELPIPPFANAFFIPEAWADDESA